MPTAWPELYNSKRWKQMRQMVLDSHPMCVVCRGAGILTQAEDVDHILAHQGDQRLFFDLDNLQAICKRCHGIKTAREVGQREVDTSSTAREAWLRTVQARPDRVATLHSRGSLAMVQRIAVVACPDIQEVPVLLCGSSVVGVDAEVVDREGGLLLMVDGHGNAVLGLIGCTNAKEVEKVKKSLEFVGFSSDTGYIKVVDDHTLVDNATYSAWYDKVCVSLRKYKEILSKNV